MAQTDVMALVPRIRRAIEGVGEDPVLSDEDVRDLAADAISEIILYSGGVFGKSLVVTEYDTDTNAPSEYATSDELTLAEASVVATQAALNYFFFKFVGLKTSERITNEAQEWEYQLSANVLRDQLALLIKDRDAALETVSAAGAPLDRYQSILAVRDAAVAAAVEPWVLGVASGGQNLAELGR